MDLVRLGLERGSSAKEADGPGLTVLSLRVSEQEGAFYQKWAGCLSGPIQGKRRYLRYWERKTALLSSPARPTVDGDPDAELHP